MSEEKPPQTTIIGALSHFSDQLFSALPPAFLMLVLLNVVFLGIILWFLNGITSQRVMLVSKLLDACMKSQIP